MRTEDPDAVELSPVARRADIVVLFEEQGRPVLAVVVEPQFSRDEYVEGMAKNTAKCILAFLDARGLAVSPDERARIQACRDLTTLDCWIVRAATASATRELFEEQ